MKHQSYIDTLHADKKVDGSLANLKYNAENEQKVYEESLIDLSEISKFITIYELITILLIIGPGLRAYLKLQRIKCLAIQGLLLVVLE